MQIPKFNEFFVEQVFTAITKPTILVFLPVPLSTAHIKIENI